MSPQHRSRRPISFFGFCAKPLDNNAETWYFVDMETNETPPASTNQEHSEMIKARIYINRDPSYPVWDVYIPDGPTYWQKVSVEGTEEAAIRYCERNGLEIEQS